MNEILGSAAEGSPVRNSGHLGKRDYSKVLRRKSAGTHRKPVNFVEPEIEIRVFSGKASIKTRILDLIAKKKKKLIARRARSKNVISRKVRFNPASQVKTQPNTQTLEQNSLYDEDFPVDPSEVSDAEVKTEKVNNRKVFIEGKSRPGRSFDTGEGMSSVDPKDE